jgi:rSAM/selenodomain-associated transferase 1
MRHRECLIIFTRYPEPGTTKTRLIPHLGRRGAADIQRQMTGHVLAQALPLMTSRGLELEIRYEGGDARLMRAWLGDAVTYVRQGPGDIGRRMAQAFRDAVDRGHRSIVLIGTDIPDITTALIAGAFEKLYDDKIVLGPAVDGGYYLIGLPRKMLAPGAPGLFSDIAWGTATVLQETCRRLKEQGLNYSLLETLEDVDRPEDLRVWERYRK